MALEWRIWQLCDSGLPTGGFAHSNGLEAAVACRVVQRGDVESLLSYIHAVLASTHALHAPLIAATYSARAAGHDCLLQSWLANDATVHAILTTEVARRASLSQGSALLRLAADSLAFSRESPVLAEFRQHVRATAAVSDNKPGVHSATLSPAHGHYAPTFGAICATAGIPQESCIRMMLFIMARDMLSAATRLSLIGPLQSATFLSTLSSYVDAMVAKPISPAVSQIDPVLDILQGSHEKLYTRLFNS